MSTSGPPGAKRERNCQDENRPAGTEAGGSASSITPARVTGNMRAAGAKPLAKIAPGGGYIADLALAEAIYLAMERVRIQEEESR